MALRYENWVLLRLQEAPPCSIEPQMSCIPLRDDPICMECYALCVEAGEADVEEGGNPPC